MQSLPSYDPHKRPDDNFTDVWTKLVQYGSREYFTEDDYLSALPVLLNGDPLEEFQAMHSKGERLNTILDYFAVRYSKQVTIKDHKSAVDNFKRLHTEALLTSMARASTLIDKLAILHTDTAWPEMRSVYQRQILNQIIHQRVKHNLDYEEAKLIEEGGTYTIDTLIRIASRYETAHGLEPTKDVETLYQTVSGQLKVNAIAADKMDSQIRVLKQQQHPTKDLSTKFDDLANIIVNAVTFKDTKK